MEDFTAFEDDGFKNADTETQKEFVNYWVDKTYADDEEYKSSDDATKLAFKEHVAERFVPKGAVDTAIGWAKDFGNGGLVNADEYGATINKGLDKILPDSVSEAIGLKENQKFWNDRKKIDENDINNKWVGLAGKILLDPVNATPVGIANKGGKVARIAKSVAGGTVIGAGTTALKNYGDETLSFDEKADQDLIGAGAVGVINGLIAGFTKGRVTNAVKDISDDFVGAKSNEDIANSIVKNADDFGLSADEAQNVAQEINKIKPPKVPDEFKVEEAGFKTSPEQNFVQVPQHPPATKEQLSELDQIDVGFRNLSDEINGVREVQPQYKKESVYPEQPQSTPLPNFVSEDFNKNLPIPYGNKAPEATKPPEAPPVEQTPQQKLQGLKSDIVQANRKADFEESVNNVAGATKLREEATLLDTQAQSTRVEIGDELLKNPRAEELLKMRESVLAKDSKSPQNLVTPRYIRESNSGNGWEIEVTPATYEKNYNNDFELTKQDVKNIQTGKFTDDNLAKLETDLGTLDNHPDYAPQSNDNKIDLLQNKEEPTKSLTENDFKKKYSDSTGGFDTNFKSSLDDDYNHKIWEMEQAKEEKKLPENFDENKYKKDLKSNYDDWKKEYDNDVSYAKNQGWMQEKKPMSMKEKELLKNNQKYNIDSDSPIFQNEAYENQTVGTPTVKEKKIDNIDEDMVKSYKEKNKLDDTDVKMSNDDWEEANTLFSKSIDNVAVGAYAGIDEDENGNITISPEKFLLGLGGYSAVKYALKNKQVQGVLKEYAQKAIDTVDMNPAVYKENGINAMSPVKSKSQKEKRGIYNVQHNDKSSTNIYKDDEFAESVIKYEKGKADYIGKDGKDKNGFGALHIDKHLGKDKDGWVSETELLNIGNAIRNTNPKVSKNSVRVYEYKNSDNVRFRVIIGDKKKGERTISFFSNRKAGSGNDSQNYIYNQPLHKEIIPQEAEKIKIDENFKEWFSGSKVVDDKGEPLIAYHGTNKDFDSFDINKASRSKLGEGFYFTPNPKSASRYAENAGIGMNIKPTYLNIQNPFDLSIKENYELWKKYDTKKLSGKPFTDALKKQGYDGVISKNGNEIVAFEPTQIKSINNKGTFDKTNPNILQSNGMHSLAGGFAGGSDSLINQRDYNGDGEYDYKDLLAGVVAGTVSINALKKMAPKLFDDGLKDGDNVAGMFVGTKAGEKGEVTYIKDHGSVDGTSSSRVTSPDQSADSLNKSIPQESQKAKAKAKGYDHVRKIVSDESIQEWGDAATAWKRNFTDTLSAEYHKVREGVTSSVNGETIKLERLHNALKELSETDRTALHNYVAGESKTIDKAIEPLAKKMKADIKALSKELVDRKVLSEESFKEWEDHYIHRSYEKYFMGDVKNLLNKGFKLEEIHARGKIEQLSAKKAKEFASSVKPELLKRPLKDGGVRLKNLPNGKVELRRDWTQAEREAMGEITDGAITIPETLMRLKRMSDNAKMLEDLVKLDNVVLESGEKLTKEELDDMGYALAPNSVKFGALSQKVIRKDVLQDIQGINDNLFNTFGKDGAMGRVWKSYLSTWKKAKTVWNVPSHVNNFMSNAFLMHLAGMSSVEVVTSVGRAGKMMIHGNAYEELLKKQMLGKATKKNLQDLAQMGDDLKYFIEAKEGGLLGRSQLNDILAGKQNDLAKKSVLSKLDKFAQDAYHNGDAINRIAMYSHLRQKINLEPEEARAMVLSVMPDYSKPMPAGYRALRDTGISPFISWTYYTMPTVIKMIRTKQGAKQAAKAMGTLAALEWALTGGEITPLDNVPFMDTKKPKDYKGRRFGIWSSKDKITTLKTDRWIPYVELISPINFGVGLFSGPTTKAIVNLVTSISKNGPIDTYTGRPITYNDGALKFYDYMKYVSQSYVPLPAQAYTGWNITESILKDEKKRRTNKTVVPRTPLQEVAKFSGLNSLTYSKKGLKKDQKKDK